MTKRARAAWMVVAGVLLGGGAVALRTWSDHRHGPAGIGQARKGADGAQEAILSPHANQALSWAPRGRPADNAGVRSVREAQETHQHPERLSPLVAPRPFDQEAFAANREAYLGVVEPGRCFQTETHPGPDSVYLEALTSITPVADETGVVTLSVKTAPLAPVTFTSFGPGYFSENTLNSVSVQADVQGVAVAHYAVVPGALASIPITAGSPRAVGNQTFFIGTGPGRVASNGNTDGAPGQRR